MASAAYERRNARARSLGYRNYYDYRAHDHGRIAPGEPRVTGEQLRRLRGHAARADAIDLLQAGRVELAMLVIEERRPDGQPKVVRLTLMLDDGSDRDFLLRGSALQPEKITELVDAMKAAGVDRMSHYTVRQLLGLAEEDEEEPEEDYEEAEEGQTYFSDEDIPF